MKSIDEIRDSWTKRQKYLFWRVIVIALLGIFGLDGLYSTIDIGHTAFLNSISLFALPLLLEYNLGMETYSGYTKLFRWSGFIINLCLVAICVIGYMGKLELKYTNDDFLQGFILFNSIHISTIVLKGFTYAIMSITMFDFIFTFNSREMFYLKAQSDIEKTIEGNYQKYKEERSLVKRKLGFKTKILSELNSKG